MKRKVTFVDKSKYKKCWACNGTGVNFDKKIENMTRVPECLLCKGKCKLKKDNYHLIYTNEKGQKQAFQVDGIK